MSCGDQKLSRRRISDGPDASNLEDSPGSVEAQAPDRDGSEVEVVKDSQEKEDEDGSDGLVVPKVSFNEKTEKEIVVPDEVRRAVDEFVVPEGYVRSGARSIAHFYSWGVNIVPHGSDPTGKRTKKWFCLASSSCRHKRVSISTKDAKSGVNKHLKSQHGIVGSLSIKRQKTADSMASAVGEIEESSRTFGVGRIR